MSTVPDEENSRGRPSSRWWEASIDGSVGRGGQKIERTKRESKYMGLAREARENLQWVESELSPFFHSETPKASSSQRSAAYCSNEYPPEKTSLHERSADQTSPPLSSRYNSHPVTATLDSHKLDVSRLVTLPPPYPRHHPAVNNNHPDLSALRTHFRSLSDLAEVAATKQRHNAGQDFDRASWEQVANDRRRKLHIDIQARIKTGSMSFAEAANTEAEFDASESESRRVQAKADFDRFKGEVMSPLRAIFSERITKASTCIYQLCSGLYIDAQDPNPNQTQEEGDEQPELLEKLTLLKWLSETREQLHQELFDLQGEQDSRYKELVLMPYHQANAEDKVRDVENFFKRDSQERKLKFEKDSFRRLETFMAVVEDNVTRGVEVQLSAFWDIAPNLLAVVQRVPIDLDGFGVLIPQAEYHENPAYYQFPMQYLHSLLVHAGKSTYQFIESQTNLLCLLHEVKTGAMSAGSRLMETQRCIAGENPAVVVQEIRGLRSDEEDRLTLDLKDKVREVEAQWDEALGNGLKECMKRVEKFLLRSGGWDETLQD
ncbi:hypothetical protein B0A49_07487 [Cryomyces minteri]|uniref:Uncharacterized protein n=3 Tax=Cryomyces minteri TaxID=331657 RepID=A0A4U0XLB2_9PEZI|nr:hypothetical protein B0A49_07487 [Cryomyces minteri]